MEDPCASLRKETALAQDLADIYGGVELSQRKISERKSAEDNEQTIKTYANAQVTDDSDRSYSPIPGIQILSHEINAPGSPSTTADVPEEAYPALAT